MTIFYSGKALTLSPSTPHS